MSVATEIRKLTEESDRRARLIRAVLFRNEDGAIRNAFLEYVDVRYELNPELRAELDTVFQEGQLHTLGEES